MGRTEQLASIRKRSWETRRRKFGHSGDCFDHEDVTGKHLTVTTTGEVIAGEMS